MKFSLLLFAAVSAAALASPVWADDSRVEMICGKKVTIYPMSRNLSCGSDTVAGGCTTPTGPDSYDIHYNAWDHAILEHEKEHPCGMRHTKPWRPVGFGLCAKVLEGGQTQWKAGDIMCRMGSGPPEKMDDARTREAFK